MRLIDADELYEKTVKWEERALQNVTSAGQDGDANKLMIWSAVLTERSAFKYDVADAPTIAQPERKTGRWKGYNSDRLDWQRDDGSPIFISCSECFEIVMNNCAGHWNFCPNCGADMRGESDD